MKIYLMAQGKGSRWEWNKGRKSAKYKQLVKVGDEPLIVRTLRQLQDRGETNTLVIADGDFFPKVKEYAMLQTNPEPVGTINEGILSLYRGWTEEKQSVFLLGDVVFSNQALDTILQSNRSFAIFGRKGRNKYTSKVASEIFAVSVRGSKVKWLKELLMILKRKEAPKLWDMYDVVKYQQPNPMIKIDDYTDDVDSPGEYQEWFKTLEKLALEDDANWQ